MQFREEVNAEHIATFSSLIQELLNFRLLRYESNNDVSENVIIFPARSEERQQIPYFSDLKIACGYFTTSDHSSQNIEYIGLPGIYGKLDPAKHFIARASGESMKGGKNPIKDGDYLLLELITSDTAGTISNQAIAIERQDVTGDDQYVLRDIKKRPDGGYDLIARNPDYPIFHANDEMRPFARLRTVIAPHSFALHKRFMREEIPPLFGYEFNPGSWNSGHVKIRESKDQYLLVTLNKQGKLQEHQYHDYFIDKNHFHWQSQNKTEPNNAKGKAIINHAKDGSEVHLFVRKNKLEGKTAAPFIYCGTLNYENHTGSKPMNVVWHMEEALPDELFEYFTS